MADQVQGVPAPPPLPHPLWPQYKQDNRPNNSSNSKIILPLPHMPCCSKQGQQIVHLNWSHFNPEFSGKPDEDAEAHLHCTNDWMNAHHFIEGVKVQRFCSTLLGKAILWYHSLEPINKDWQGLQNLFRQQYSKICYTREQLINVWRSFSFDENTEIIDAYVTCIRQVAALLGYGESQILQVFKNTLVQNCIGYYSL